MPAPDTVLRLVDNFGEHLDHYKSAGYNETQVRREFLDPFYKCLGWDIDNQAGYADAYKDVIHEDAIRIGSRIKAPDYCFRIGGQRKFFLEAKKPSVSIKTDVSPAFQLRRYAWSAKLPLSILSDFEELAVYDCRVRPVKNDKASTARTLYYTFDQYAEKWDEIAGVFDREAVLRGSFDRYADSKKKKRGTAEVDEAFLAEIERWRELLARNFALRNTVSVRDLNYAVQKTIDRLIFLRMCEDRGTEDYGRLQGLQSGARAYPRLLEQFRRADDRYNSGLFHFGDERDRPGAPDAVTPGLKLDDKVIQNIVKHLYYPDSPYEFSVLPADILGQVYEQFLGKTIRLSSEHRATIEEKPEVRKAGGVYYTPGYIVDYIVGHTLGRLLNGADPERPRPIPVSQAEKIKVVDPACGSGSFLIVAYQYLLDWHRDQYTLDPETREPDAGKIARHSGGKSPKIYQARGGGHRLTTPERRRILLNNIHGVDIDSQAVEVTKLSLLLKALEGETQQTVQRDFLGERQRILPDLGRNIQCGNSLIGPDFYDQPDLPDLDDETLYRINVFDWKSAFPDVFEQGGFDCVIGNPPYIRIQTLSEWAPDEAKRYKESYRSATRGNFDIYVCFIEKGINLLSETGRIGYIVPHKFFNADYGSGLRSLISAGRHLEKLISFGAEQVFRGATTYTCLCFATRTPNQSVTFERAYDLPSWRADSELNLRTMSAAYLGDAEWYLLTDDERRLLESLRTKGMPLSAVASSISQGLKTGADTVFVVESTSSMEGIVSGQSKALSRHIEIESAFTLRVAKGGDIRRYAAAEPKRHIVFPYDRAGDLIPSSTLETRAPRTWAYLRECRAVLDNRERGKFAGPRFYQFSRAQCLRLAGVTKILTPDIAPEPSFALDLCGETAFLGGAAGGYGITLPKNVVPTFVLGIMNSGLLGWYILATSTVFRGGWRSYESRFIGGFPIRTIDFENPADVAKHDRMVKLVESMLELHAKKAAEKNPDALRQLETRIAATDGQIDRLVYELYELTEEEIAIVEGREATTGLKDEAASGMMIENIEVMPGIEKTKGVCGGDARIGASRIPVWAVEQLRRLGQDDAGILETYAGLSQQDLDAARDYASAHREEIEAAIRENEEA